MKKATHTAPGLQQVPFSCRVLLWMAQTYYGLINLLFVVLLIMNERMIKAIEPYFESENFDSRKLILFLAVAVLILMLCNAGILLMQMKRKGGFYLYLSGAIVLLVIDSFFLQFDLFRYLLNTGFIFMTGILHFTGRCYGNPPRRGRKKAITGE